MAVRGKNQSGQSQGSSTTVSGEALGVREGVQRRPVTWSPSRIVAPETVYPGPISVASGVATSLVFPWSPTNYVNPITWVQTSNARYDEGILLQQFIKNMEETQHWLVTLDSDVSCATNLGSGFTLVSDMSLPLMAGETWFLTLVYTVVQDAGGTMSQGLNVPAGVVAAGQVAFVSSGGVNEVEVYGLYGSAQPDTYAQPGLTMDDTAGAPQTYVHDVVVVGTAGGLMTPAIQANAAEVTLKAGSTIIGMRVA